MWGTERAGERQTEAQKTTRREKEGTEGAGDTETLNCDRDQLSQRETWFRLSLPPVLSASPPNPPLPSYPSLTSHRSMPSPQSTVTRAVSAEDRRDGLVTLSTHLHKFTS